MIRPLKRLSGVAVGLVGLGLAASGCGLAPYVAKVNGAVITRSQLFDEMNAIASDPALVSSYAKQGVAVKGTAKGTFTTSFADQILDQQITLAIIRQANQKRKQTVSADDVAIAKEDLGAGSAGYDSLPKAYQTDLVNTTAALTVLESSLAGIPITQASIRTYYAAHVAALSKVCVSIIVETTKARAVKVEGILGKGANFAATAKSQSADPSTAANGGALGCALPQSFGQAINPSFASVVQTLAVGKPSPLLPLSTPSGASVYVIAEVTSRTVLSETQAVPEILLMELKPTASKFSSFLAAQIRAAKVSVDPSYGRYSVKNGSVDVLAPTAPPAAALVRPPTTTTTGPGSSPTAPAGVAPAPPATAATPGTAKPPTTPGTAKPPTTPSTAKRATTPSTAKRATSGSS